MYCFLDDLLTLTRPTWAQPADPRRHLNDAQVLTTALVDARFFGGQPGAGSAPHRAALGTAEAG